MFIMDNLRKLNLIVVYWCCMCKKSRETINHVLLHCEVARALRNSVFGLCWLEWVMPQRLVDL